MAGFRWYVPFFQLHRCFLSLETGPPYVLAASYADPHIRVTPADHITARDSPEKIHAKFLSSQHYMRNANIDYFLSFCFGLSTQYNTIYC